MYKYVRALVSKSAKYVFIHFRALWKIPLSGASFRFFNKKWFKLAAFAPELLNITDYEPPSQGR